MTVEMLRERKKELGYSYEQIAKLSGVPLGTVQKIFGGITKSPRYATLKALEAVLCAENGNSLHTSDEQCRAGKSGSAKGNAGSGFTGEDKIINADVVCESSAYKAEVKKNEFGIPGKEQGEFTLEDYYALPEERRVELIDGVFYDMAAPTSVHQLVLSEIWSSFSSYIKKNNGHCIPAVAPLDVWLDKDEKTMVQPDIMVVCDREKFKRGIVCGAPDLIVEILSGSTRKKDMVLKTHKYADAGVREYWVVDPGKKKVIVYKFVPEVEISIYPGTGSVPVGIWNGECSVNFAEIFDYVSFLEDQEVF